MIHNLNFNTPINFDPRIANYGVQVKAKWLGYLTDSYFNFGTKRAVLLKNSPERTYVQISDCCLLGKDVYCANFLKVISWITVITPLLMLIGKVIFRSLNSFAYENYTTDKQTIISGITHWVQTQNQETITECKDSEYDPNDDEGDQTLGVFQDHYARRWIFTKVILENQESFLFTLLHTQDHEVENTSFFSEDSNLYLLIKAKLLGNA